MNPTTQLHSASRPGLLLADDDEAVRGSLYKVLLGEGYRVVLATNGAEAIEALHHNKDSIDLLLVDLKMPQKNGWATLDRFNEMCPHLPVVVLTGMSNQRELAEASGVSALVEKPIEISGLLQLMRELLPRRARPDFQGSARKEFQFRHLVPAGRAPLRLWKQPSVAPYTHGGLNE